MKLIGRVPGWEGTWEVGIEGDRVTGVREVEAPGDAPWVSPGFIDLQVNGFMGFDINADTVTAETVEAMVRALWTTGVTRVCPTVITGPLDRIERSLRAIAAARRHAVVRHSIVGIHLEGPYISPEDGPRGAHSRAHVHPPSWDEFARLQEAAEGLIRLVTVAPEIDGALPFIESLSSHGVIPAIGHSAASAADIRHAVAAGARLSTHLGNGCHAVLPRHPNPIWCQLAADGLYASFIADGFHLPAEVVKTFIRAKGLDRSILVTDAIAAAGLPPGSYELGGLPVEVAASGRVELKGTPYLAGSSLTMPRAVLNAMRMAGLELPQALRLVTENPAVLLGIHATNGNLRPGAHADLVEFEYSEVGGLRVLRTIVAGQVVYGP